MELQSFSLFQGVPNTDLAALAAYMQPVHFAEGQYLFFKGDPATCVYLIQKGSVEVLKRLSDETQVQLAVREEGDSIGEMALIDTQPRPLSVRALEEVEGLRFDHQAMQQIYGENRDLYIRIILNIARQSGRRLQAMDSCAGGSLFGAAQAKG